VDEVFGLVDEYRATIEAFNFMLDAVYFSLTESNTPGGGDSSELSK